ncbi:21347_t:CDS:2 [Entrophospora sp. SA101]|nr:21347_t:CDS:2 [Entrophospora sp. SA101]
MSTINEIIVEIKELINLINENERHLRDCVQKLKSLLLVKNLENLSKILGEKFEKKQDIGGILDKILEETSGDNDFTMELIERLQFFLMQEERGMGISESFLRELNKFKRELKKEIFMSMAQTEIDTYFS